MERFTVYTFFMYVRIHVCICTFYRGQPWRCPVDVNNGVLVIYFDFKRVYFGLLMTSHPFLSIFISSRFETVFSQDGRLLDKSQNIDITLF